MSPFMEGNNSKKNPIAQGSLEYLWFDRPSADNISQMPLSYKKWFSIFYLGKQWQHKEREKQFVMVFSATQLLSKVSCDFPPPPPPH